MVESGGTRDADQGNLGVNLSGGQEKAVREGHAVGYGIRYIGVRQTEGWIFQDGDRRLPGGQRTL